MPSASYKPLKPILKDTRVIIFLLTILISLIIIQPIPKMGSDGKYTLSLNIPTGIDLSGGVSALLKPQIPTQENAQKIVRILDSRISSFGLKEARMSVVKINGEYYVEITMAEATEKDLKTLIAKQGMFEAYIERDAIKEGNNYYLLLKGKKYKIDILNNQSVKVEYKNGTILKINQSALIDGIYVKLYSLSPQPTFKLLVFKGDAVIEVFRDAEHSRVYRVGDQYVFEFDITISRAAAKTFGEITKDMKVINSPDGAYLDKKIEFYLDGKLIDALNIAAGLKGNENAVNIQIRGTGKTKEEAINNMKRLQAILTSGALPCPVKIVETNNVSPTLGKNFMNVAIYSILAAITAVAIVVYLRYKEPLFVIPMILTSITEVLTILAFAALVKWTIDLPSIAGIVAAVGTGIDDQIVVVDESKKEEMNESLKRRIKRAFFIIFGSAFTTMAAMTPLLFSSMSYIKGFAFTTIVGITIGITITRPAFARVVEYFKD